MSRLNQLVPDGFNSVNRSTLLTIADLIFWLSKNQPDAFKAAIQANGQQEVKKALNDLETHCELWR